VHFLQREPRGPALHFVDEQQEEEELKQREGTQQESIFEQRDLEKCLRKHRRQVRGPFDRVRQVVQQEEGREGGGTEGG